MIEVDWPVEVSKEYYPEGELIRGTPIFRDEETGKIFRRIVAGMQWPGIFPGAVVVLGEISERNQILGKHEIHVLDDYQNQGLSELIGRCCEMKGFLKVQEFYGDTGNIPMMRVARTINVNFELSKAPYVDTQDVHKVYLSLIWEATSETKKVLNFGGKRALPEALSSLKSLPTGGLSDYPLIVALGYALSAFVAYPYQKPRPPEPGYDPLDPIIGL